jgi:hypothetical protein
LLAGKREEKDRKRGKISGIRENSSEYRVMREVLTGLVGRHLADVAAARFAEEPVLVLNGPRTGWGRVPCSARWLAARSGQVLNITAAAGAIGLERSTAENYTKLLEAVFLIHRLPAWGTTLSARIVKHPKVHMVDSGVMAWLLDLTPQKVAQADPSTLTEYGHLLETFAVGEILKHVSWSDGWIQVVPLCPLWT